MSTKRLKNYLDAINSKKPIDAEKFHALLRQLNLQHPVSPSDFLSEKVQNNKYLVQVVNSKLFDELSVLASLDDNSRASLASQNRSHDTSVNGSMLIVRQDDKHPTIMVFDFEKQYQGLFPLNATCLVVENEQNFLQSKQSLKLMRDHGLIGPEPIDVIYGNGASITNQLYDLFLEQYSTISLLMDFDLGGLSIARTLINRHGEKKIRFLYPKDIETRLSKVIIPQSPEYLIKVEKIARECPHLAQPARIMRKHRKVIEQEDYLNNV